MYNLKLIIYNKSVKFAYSSRSTRASQSPNKVEKQPKSTPDMLNPPHLIARRGYITYPHGHSLWLLRLYSLNFAKIQSSRKQRSNKRLIYVLAVLRRQATTKTFAGAKVRRNFGICK